MNIFINQNEQRLRTGWRLIVQFFLMYLIGFMLIGLFHTVIAAPGSILLTTLFAAGAVLSVILAARGLDKRPKSDFGISFNRQSVRHGALGFVLAGIAMGIIFLIEYFSGWLIVTGYGWTQLIHHTSFISSLLANLGFMIVVGFYEELVFRGYQVVNLSEGLNISGVSREKAVWGAVIISSLIFGSMHVFNPDVGLLSILIVALAGVMLAFPFIITGNLSLSIGLHIGWNFFEGGIFGFAVSGMPSRTPLLQIQQKGPHFITGGSFGPEAGLMGLIGLLLVVLALWWYFKKYAHSLTIYEGFGVYQPHSAVILSKKHEQSL
jgi:membrane protease YdiL (CAAX protease family)